MWNEEWKVLDEVKVDRVAVGGGWSVGNHRSPLSLTAAAIEVVVQLLLEVDRNRTTISSASFQMLAHRSAIFSEIRSLVDQLTLEVVDILTLLFLLGDSWKFLNLYQELIFFGIKTASEAHGDST